jgi:hypothetical protein
MLLDKMTIITTRNGKMLVEKMTFDQVAGSLGGHGISFLCLFVFFRLPCKPGQSL